MGELGEGGSPGSGTHVKGSVTGTLTDFPPPLQNLSRLPLLLNIIYLKEKKKANKKTTPLTGDCVGTIPVA